MHETQPNPPKGYFEEAEEAIREYLTTCNQERKNQLFQKTIDPALKKLVKGVMRMPKFQKIIGIPLDELEEATYYHIVFQLERFDLNRMGKDGELVKAFSYFGTCAKNHILAAKIAADKKIAKYGGIVNIAEVKSDISQSKSDFRDFEDLKVEIVNILTKLPSKCKLTKNDIIVNNSLTYMLNNWHSIDFQDKNEFVRLLVSYTHLSPSVVSTSLKKIKTLITQSSDSLCITKKKKKASDLYDDENLETFIEGNI